MLKTIKSQMIVSYTMMILALYALISFVIYGVLNNHLLQTQLNHQTQTAEALCKAIQNWRDDYENISFDILSDEHIQSYLRESDQNFKQANYREFIKRLTQYERRSQAIKGIYVMDDAYQLCGTALPSPIRTYILDRIARAEQNKGGAVWDSGYEVDYLVLYRKINDQKYDVNKKLGYLFLVIENEEILSLFNDYRLDPTQRFCLKGYEDSFEVSERGFFYNFYEDYDNLLHSDVTLNGWNLRTWTNKSVALAPTKDLFISLRIVLIITLVVSLLLIWLLSWRITVPISKMKTTINQFSSGDFSARVPIVHDDEIGDLAHTLNSMAMRIRILFEEVNRKEKQRRKLELQTLEYQINPHFLYNTLDSINILARQNKDIRVAEIVTSLSRFFRLGLHHGQEIVTVRDEIMHVSYYLNIQRIRFEDQLTWSTEVEDEILNMEIIKFLLQPCAENSINHGIRKLNSPGHVKITGKREGGEIVFQVIDNGAGIPPERLEYIRRNLDGTSKSRKEERMGFGLSNVHQRIQLNYGENYGLQIDSELNSGTIVTIRIPI